MIQIYRRIDELPFDPRTVLTIGSFDGVHLGHRMILEAVKGEAAAIDGRSVVVTFHPHPQEVLRSRGDSVPILTTLEERVFALADVGIDALLVVEFTKEFAATPWREFMGMLLEKVGVAHIVVGHDHAFGKNREGNVDSLKKLGEEVGFGVTEIGPLVIDGETISSTKIRRALQEGDVALAHHYLGRPYSLQGTVVKGDGRGRTLGIPTANIEPLDRAKLLPANGVYCVEVEVLGRRVRGMANIGVRPTFTDGTRQTLEVNLFDFDDDIYHSSVTVEFRKFVRSEQTFGSKEAFLSQLEQDRALCRQEESGSRTFSDG